MSLLLAGSLAAGWRLDQLALDPSTAGHLHLVLTDVAGKVTIGSAAILFWTLVDLVLFPWLNIADVIRGKVTLPVEIRAAVVLGWLVLASGIVLAFAIHTTY